MATLEHDLALALDPVAFAHEALGFTPDEWQARVLRWNGKQLLMNCSRQSGKSTTTAILALHRALYMPKSLTLLVSPSQRQSSELFKKVTDFMRRLEVQPVLVEDNKLSCEFDHGSRVVSLPASDGKIRGFSGVSLIIEDEASRVDDQLYFALRPMLAVSGGQLILMSTPYGKRGHFYMEWENGAGEWDRIMVNATQCPRIPEEFLANERRTMGERFYVQEYMCMFRDTIEQVFATDLVERMFTPDVKTLADRMKQ